MHIYILGLVLNTKYTMKEDKNNYNKVNGRVVQQINKHGLKWKCTTNLLFFYVLRKNRGKIQFSFVTIKNEYNSIKKKKNKEKSIQKRFLTKFKVIGLRQWWCLKLFIYRRRIQIKYKIFIRLT